MLMPFVDAYEQSILNYIFRDLALPLPATQWFIGLFTTTPNEAGATGVEVTGGAYARQAVVRSPTGSAGFDAASGTAPAFIDNTAVITFPQATASWGTVLSWGLFDAVTAGNLRFFATLSTSKTVATGDTASIAAGAMKVNFGKSGDNLLS
jgi:hypothetical protein